MLFTSPPCSNRPDQQPPAGEDEEEVQCGQDSQSPLVTGRKHSDHLTKNKKWIGLLLFCIFRYCVFMGEFNYMYHAILFQIVQLKTSKQNSRTVK